MYAKCFIKGSFVLHDITHSLASIFFPAKTRTAHRWLRNYLWNGWEHGLINYIDTMAKFRHLKNWPVKGLCGRYLSEFIDWSVEIESVMVGILDPALWSVAPLTFSLVQLPSPLLCVKAQTDIKWLEGVGDAESCWRPYTYRRSLTLCIWPDSEPTKLLDHPKQNPRRGGGLRQINTCQKDKFLDDDILVCCLYR